MTPRLPVGELQRTGEHLLGNFFVAEETGERRQEQQERKQDSSAMNAA